MTTQKNNKRLRDLNAQPVSADDLARAVRAAGAELKSPAALRQGGALAKVIAAFPGETEKAGAVFLRASALFVLMANGKLPGWTMADMEPDKLDLQLLDAAASEPLICVGEQFTLKPESLCARALFDLPLRPA